MYILGIYYTGKYERQPADGQSIEVNILAY